MKAATLLLAVRRGAMALCAFAGLAAPAGAQALHDHFWLEAGIFLPSVDTDVSLTHRSGATDGTRIDFERDLALDGHKTLPSVYGGARLGSGFSLTAEYYSLGRDGQKSLTRDIVFDDVTYSAGATVSSKFDTDIYRLSLGWAFVRKPNWEMGVALGLHATDIKTELSGQGHVGTATSQVQTRRDKVLAPLPTIGLFASVEPIRDLTFSGRVDVLSLKIDKYDGKLLNAQLAVSWRFMKNIGAGIAYRYVDYRLDVTQTNAIGRFAYKFHGPSLFMTFGF
ncbi:MAG: outer membrane beta-barrel protein [Allosphingosinicella sp.]